MHRAHRIFRGRERIVRAIICFCLTLSLAVSVIGAPAPSPLPPTAMLTALPPFCKGVTVSCQTWGVEWQTPQMAQTLDELKHLGVNTIAIHPYAQIQNDGHVVFRVIDNNRHITVPLDWAQERQLSIMLVPHISYWGSKFSWRGDIKFDRQEEWDRFFADYQNWIVQMATIAEAHHVALFCVGLEFTHAQKFDAQWRAMISAVRNVYHGKLTYGANWNEYDQVRFWDALDYIGVLAYFPLTKKANPPIEDLITAWNRQCSILERFSKDHGGKQFIFTELGYNQSDRAAAEPWAFKTGGDHAEEIQRRCLATALALTGKQQFLAGMFLWKWFPDLPNREKEDYPLQTPQIKALIAKYWW